MIQTASGNSMSKKQATYFCDQTLLPYGKKLGLLTGYVRTQAGTSKRTAAGAVALQKKWHETCDKLFAEIRKRAKQVLKSDELVDKMMAWLICNLDEECVCAMGKNAPVIGAKGKKKHDNQNGSSRFVAARFFFLASMSVPMG